MSGQFYASYQVNVKTFFTGEVRRLTNGWQQGQIHQVLCALWTPAHNFIECWPTGQHLSIKLIYNKCTKYIHKNHKSSDIRYTYSMLQIYSHLVWHYSLLLQFNMKNPPASSISKWYYCCRKNSISNMTNASSWATAQSNCNHKKSGIETQVWLPWG